jgi:hypothetical protein
MLASGSSVIAAFLSSLGKRRLSLPFYFGSTLFILKRLPCTQGRLILQHNGVSYLIDGVDDEGTYDGISNRNDLYTTDDKTNTGLFLQLTAEDVEDVSIPGVPYTFGIFKRPCRRVIGKHCVNMVDGLNASILGRM